MEFGLIKDIVIGDNASWEDTLFLTIDMEWASDDSILYILDKMIHRDAKVTLFCTHETRILDSIKRDSRIDLGIHPNFNFLLEGDCRYGNTIDEVLRYYKDIVPEATCVRSHCFVTGTHFIRCFLRHGLKFDCNPLVPASAKMICKPWKSFVGNLVHVPTFWEDDIHCMYHWDFTMNNFTEADGVKVFNFHPVHVTLNINSIEHYERCKSFYSDHYQLLKERNSAMGVDDLLEELLGEA